MEKYPDITKSRIVGCHLAGKTPTEISKEFDIPRRTVRGWIDLYLRGEIEHVHHWILPKPDGPMSVGTCKYCKKQTVMSNSLEDFTGWTVSKKRKEQDDELRQLLKDAEKLLI